MQASAHSVFHAECARVLRKTGKILFPVWIFSVPFPFGCGTFFLSLLPLLPIARSPFAGTPPLPCCWRRNGNSQKTPPSSVKKGTGSPSIPPFFLHPPFFLYSPFSSTPFSLLSRLFSSPLSPPGESKRMHFSASSPMHQIQRHPIRRSIQELPIPYSDSAGTISSVYPHVIL